MIQDRYDVAVVGAGPAGMAAASLCARAGLSTVVFDRRASAGGNPGSSGEKIVASFLTSGARFVPAAEVESLTPEGEVTVHAGGQTYSLHATYVVLATGGIERPFEMPGASFPGAAMAGSASVPEGRTVLAGSGLHFWQVATRLLDAGARIEAILDTTPAPNRLRARRHWLSRLLAAPVRDHHALAAAVRRRVRVIENVGDPRAVGGVTFDHLLLHAGVVPDTALAAAVGLARRADGVPAVSEFGASSTPGIYVVGEGAGVRGAQAAPWHGTLAAADIVFTVRPEIAKPAASLARSALARFARGSAYFDALYGDPPVVLHGSSAKTAIKVGDT